VQKGRHLVVEIDRTPHMGGSPLGHSHLWRSPISSEAREGPKDPRHAEDRLARRSRTNSRWSLRVTCPWGLPPGRLSWDRLDTLLDKPASALSTPGRPALRQRQPGAAAPANLNHREDICLVCHVGFLQMVNQLGRQLASRFRGGTFGVAVGDKSPLRYFWRLSDGPKQRTNLESQAVSFSSESAFHSPMPGP
jgi:hypothetical protein